MLTAIPIQMYVECLCWLYGQQGVFGKITDQGPGEKNGHNTLSKCMLVNSEQ